MVSDFGCFAIMLMVSLIVAELLSLANFWPTAEVQAHLVRFNCRKGDFSAKCGCLEEHTFFCMLEQVPTKHCGNSSCTLFGILATSSAGS